MQRLSPIFAAILALFLAGGAGAKTITQLYSSFWVLGDSLSAFAGPPTGDTTLRASDGPLWSERVVKDFLDVGKPAASFASGGATAGLTREGTPTDLTGQVTQLLGQSGRFGDTPLVAIWIGGNDIAAIAGGMPAEQSVSAYAASLTRLIAAHVKNFLLFEVPDVGYTPLVRDFGVGDPDAASAVAAGLNTAFFGSGGVGGVIGGLPSGVGVAKVGTFDQGKTAYEDPSAFGLARRGPCFIPDVGIVDDCSMTSFWDPFHPSGALQDAIADEVYAAFGIVPLPAGGGLLLIGLGALWVLRRRR